jgi:hypothetical protein
MGHGNLPMSPMPPDPKKSLNLAERVKELERENKALRSENAQIMRENLTKPYKYALLAKSVTQYSNPRPVPVCQQNACTALPAR